MRWRRWAKRQSPVNSGEAWRPTPSWCRWRRRPSWQDARSCWQRACAGAGAAASSTSLSTVLNLPATALAKPLVKRLPSQSVTGTPGTHPANAWALLPTHSHKNQQGAAWALVPAPSLPLIRETDGHDYTHPLINTSETTTGTLSSNQQSRAWTPLQALQTILETHGRYCCKLTNS